MSTKKAENADERGLASRAGASRKLLARKGKEDRSSALAAPPLESSFPTGPHPREETPSATRVAPGRALGAEAAARRHPANCNTAFGAIVRIVAELREVSRTELLDIMGRSAFPNSTARSQDRKWCAGDVAGAVRSGFLAEVAAPTRCSKAPDADALQEL